MSETCQTCGSPSHLGCTCIQAFIDVRELEADSVRDIVVQSGCEWPADDSRESRLFRFRVRRIATEAYRRGIEDSQKVKAAVAMMFSDAQEQGGSDGSAPA